MIVDSNMLFRPITSKVKTKRTKVLKHITAWLLTLTCYLLHKNHWHKMFIYSHVLAFTAGAMHFYKTVICNSTHKVIPLWFDYNQHFGIHVAIFLSWPRVMVCFSNVGSKPLWQGHTLVEAYYSFSWISNTNACSLYRSVVILLCNA